MIITESMLRQIIKEELESVFEIAQHQDVKGRWEPEVWIGETEADGESTPDEGAVKKRRYKGKTYKASAGSLAGDVEDIEAFKWADEPWAAKQAATIVKTGHPIRRSKKKSD
jgi:hypothetical protein